MQMNRPARLPLPHFAPPDPAPESALFALTSMAGGLTDGGVLVPASTATDQALYDTALCAVGRPMPRGQAWTGAKPGQACYLQFMLAMCAMNLQPSQLREPTEILTSCSRAYLTTPTWPRVQLALWNLLQWDESTRATGLDHLTKLITSTAPQSYKDEALFHHAQLPCRTQRLASCARHVYPNAAMSISPSTIPRLAGAATTWRSRSGPIWIRCGCRIRPRPRGCGMPLIRYSLRPSRWRRSSGGACLPSS